jgi:autotransporter passenger strand-loop-strand repeat protein
VAPGASVILDGPTTVQSGGTLVAGPESLQGNFVISAGGQLSGAGTIQGYTVVYGLATQVTFTTSDIGYNTNDLTVEPGGSAVAVSVIDDLDVLSAGVADGTKILTSGEQEIYAGGKATGTIVSSGGQQVILAQAVASGTTIQLEGEETVLSGGLSIDAVVESGSGPGSPLGYTLIHGGAQTVLSGASAVSTTVQSGEAWSFSRARSSATSYQTSAPGFGHSISPPPRSRLPATMRWLCPVTA